MCMFMCCCGYDTTIGYCHVDWSSFFVPFCEWSPTVVVLMDAVY